MNKTVKSLRIHKISNKWNRSSLFPLTFIMLSILRIGFYFVFSDNTKGQILPDSTEYLALSSNFREAFLENSPDLLALSIRRPPGYPFILSLLDSNTFYVGLLQHIMVIALSAITIALCKILTENSQIAHAAGILILIEPSLFVEASVTLSEVAFVFFSTSAIYFTLKVPADQFSLHSSLYAGLLFTAAMFCRPIGIILILVFLVLLLFNLPRINWNHITILTLISVFYGIWVFRNFFLASIPEFSSQQSHNLHLWEGSGASAFARNLSIDEVHEFEASLMKSKIGDQPSISEEASYRTNRGMYLILNNFPSFLLMHTVGIGKILLGPGQGEFMSFVSNGRITRSSNSLEHLSVYCLALLTILIFAFFVIGFIRSLKSKKDKFLPLNVFLLLNLIFSSGFQAYSRFRVPISPIMCCYAAIGMWIVYRRLRFRKVT
jgi:4-amino-4-deoxy-L-arabinose transferase-like glycosyltransferase